MYPSSHPPPDLQPKFYYNTKFDISPSGQVELWYIFVDKNITTHT